MHSQQERPTTDTAAAATTTPEAITTPAAEASMGQLLHSNVIWFSEPFFLSVSLSGVLNPVKLAFIACNVI